MFHARSKYRLGGFVFVALVFLLGCNLSTSLPQSTQAGNTPAATQAVYLPLVVTSTPASPPTGGLVRPKDLTYLGAFRLPGGDEPPLTFAYGGNAMTYNPDNTTLFITGHDRQAYGTLPNGGQVAEVSIPTPVIAANPADLPQATFVQNFYNVFNGQFVGLDEIPRVGLQYLNHPVTGALLHVAWGTHMQGEPILGEGQQRRFRLLDAAYAPTRGLLFVLEPFSDGVKPVVHVWQVR